MIDINNIKLTTSVLELGLSAKLLNRLKISQVNNFQQLMELDTSKWENVVAAKVISAMRAAQAKYKEQYEKLLEQQKAAEVKQPTCPTPEVSSDPQLDGEAYSRMTNTSFAVPSTYDQRRFFVANNILNAYVLSGRLQDEEGPLPLVMREIVKVADAFMDAFDGKPYVEEEDEEEEAEIIPIPTPVETPSTPQKQESKQEPKQKSGQQQPKQNNQKQNNNQKKDKNQKQSQKQEPEKQEVSVTEELVQEESLQEEPNQIVEEPTLQAQTELIIDDVVDDPEGVYIPVREQVIEVPDYTEIEQYVEELPEVTETPYEEVVEVEEVKPEQPQEPIPPNEGNEEDQHPNAERGQHIRIAKYLGRGKRGSKYFQPGDMLTVKRMRKGDDGVIVVSATINEKNVCFDSKHYTWTLDQD